MLRTTPKATLVYRLSDFPSCTGPCQSASQRNMIEHTAGPSSPSMRSLSSVSLHAPFWDSSWSLSLNEPSSPLQDGMDTECSLRFACSHAVRFGMLRGDRSWGDDCCTYSEKGILMPQRLVSRYSCLTRNNACLDLSMLPHVAQSC